MENKLLGPPRTQKRLSAETEAQTKRAILFNARIFEMVGYSVSFASILASLCILSAFRYKPMSCVRW